MNNLPPGANNGVPGGPGLPGNGQDNRFVNDLKSTNSKQLLNAYVYDFLIKSSLPQTAQSFIKEADIPTGAPSNKAAKRPPQKELLPLAISLDAPQGFLYEWWQIFWDVFNARTHRGGSENAQQYYQMQLLRQHKEHALHNSTFHAAHAQAAASAASSLQPQQQQLLLQQQYHHQQQQLMLSQQQHQHQHPQPQQVPPQQQQPQQVHQQPQQQPSQSPHPNAHQIGHQGQPQTIPTPQQQHPNVGGSQPHPVAGVTPAAMGAPTPQSQSTPQQAAMIQQQGNLPNGNPANAPTPGSAVPGATPMAHQQHIPMQQQFPGQFGQFQQPMDATGAGAAMGNNFSQQQPGAMGQQQPDGSFMMAPHQTLQHSQQQQEVQQHFQQQQNQLYAGQKRGNMPAGMGVMPPNYARVQQAQAQFQMNQLRQQQFVQMQQAQQQGFKAPMGMGGVNGRPPYGPQGQQQPLQQHMPSSGASGSQRGGDSPNKKQKLEDSSNKNSPLAGSPQNGNSSNNPSPLTQTRNNPGAANMPSPLVNQTDKDSSATNGGSSALHDYQMQLLLLERENKKMLSVSKKEPVVAEAKKEKPSKKMPPPKSTKNASTPTAIGSPAVSSTNGAPAPSSANRKKSVASRRKASNNKKASSSANKSEPPTPTTPLTPNPTTTTATTTTTNNASSSSTANTKTTSATIPPHKLTKDSKDSDSPSNASQLTPPNSENAINSNGEVMLTNPDDIKIETQGFPQDDVISGGQAMHGVQPLGPDLYTDFALSDFSNEISGDGNFNLETFLNTDGGDMAFDSYWRDSVEATD